MRVLTFVKQHKVLKDYLKEQKKFNQESANPQKGRYMQKAKNSMIYGYINITRNRDINKEQEKDILSFASGNHLEISGWLKIDFTDNANRLQKLKKDDVLIVSNLFRLGRDITGIMIILKDLMEKGITVYSAKDNLRLGNDMMASVMAYCFGLVASIARENRAQLTKEGLDTLKRSGRRLGRPSTSANKKTQPGGRKEKKHSKAAFLNGELQPCPG